MSDKCSGVPKVEPDAGGGKQARPLDLRWLIRFVVKVLVNNISHISKFYGTVSLTS